jgi:hypothetical protein
MTSKSRRFPPLLITCVSRCEKLGRNPQRLRFSHYIAVKMGVKRQHFPVQ